MLCAPAPLAMILPSSCVLSTRGLPESVLAVSLYILPVAFRMRLVNGFFSSGRRDPATRLGGTICICRPARSLLGLQEFSLRSGTGRLPPYRCKCFASELAGLRRRANPGGRPQQASQQPTAALSSSAWAKLRRASPSGERPHWVLHALSLRSLPCLALARVLGAGPFP